MSINGVSSGRGLTGWLEIDQSPCRASYGLKLHSDWLRDQADKARRAAMEGLVRRAQEGNRMARIESKEDAIVQMAIEKNLTPDRGVLAIVPIKPPIIRYHPGKGALVDLYA